MSYVTYFNEMLHNTCNYVNIRLNF